MKISELLGWIIGALDLVFMVYSVVDLTPLILMVGISLLYIATMIIINRKIMHQITGVKSQTYVKKNRKH